VPSSSKRESATGGLARGLIGGALVLLAGAGVYSVSGGSGPTSVPPPAAAGGAPASPVSASLPSSRPPPAATAEPREQAPEAAGPAPLEPWQVSRENTPPPPEGYVPAWKVRPPRPEQLGQVPLPPPREPPEPSLHRPPVENPGGVNGDRPARPVPGIE
jgi:hypothetical protein